MPEVRLIGDDGNQIGVVSTRRGAPLRAGARPRPRRGGRRRPPARLPRARLLEVQVRAGAEGQGRPPHQKQVNVREIKLRPKIATQRLRDQEEPRRALPQGRRPREGHDHVPRPRADATPSAASALLMRLAEDVADLGVDRAAPAAGRPQHDDAARAGEEASRGRAAAASRWRRPSQPPARGTGAAGRRSGGTAGRGAELPSQPEPPRGRTAGRRAAAGGRSAPSRPTTPPSRGASASIDRSPCRR